MVALETGWTPDMLAELPAGFLAGCRWALYVRAIVGAEGIGATDPPGPGLPVAQRMAAMRRNAEIARLRTHLYPEGD